MTDQQRTIVIGSGPSGATAALALLERGIPVTMLESGQMFRAGLVIRALGRNLFRQWAPIAEGYAYVATGDPDTEWQSALSPGGLSNYWTGAVPRFAPEDFLEGARLHERYRWPISYAELAPYYTYVERLLGVVGERRAVPQASTPEELVQERQLPGGWRAVAEGAETRGQGLWYAPLADGPNWHLRRAGHAFNSFDRIVSRLGRFPGFELRLGAHAQKLTWNSALGRVDGVDFVDRSSGQPQHLAASAVVVAAGPLASPKLLMQSTSIDFPDGLGNTNGVLGCFLHDHPKDWCVLDVDRPLPRLDQPLHLTRAPYADSPPLLAASITIGPMSKWDRILSLVGANTTQFGLVTFATMLPEERNYLRLDPEKRDQFGMPVLDVHIRYGAEVAETIAAAHDRFLAVLSRAGIRGTLECPQDKLVPGSAAHYGGGARMHASREFGVLDGRNRLHGVDNVAVVDASSFTTAVEKNPTLTAMALAARAADRLADDFKHNAIGRPAQQARAVSTLR